MDALPVKKTSERIHGWKEELQRAGVTEEDPGIG